MHFSWRYTDQLFVIKRLLYIAKIIFLDTCYVNRADYERKEIGSTNLEIVTQLLSNYTCIKS